MHDVAHGHQLLAEQYFYYSGDCIIYIIRHLGLMSSGWCTFTVETRK